MNRSQYGMTEIAEEFVQRGWRVWYLPGRSDPFIWDPASGYLASIAPSLLESIAEHTLESKLGLKHILHHVLAANRG